MKNILLVLFSLVCLCTQAKVKFTSEGFADVDGVVFSLVWMDGRWQRHIASNAGNNAVWKPVKITASEMIYDVTPPSGEPGRVRLWITPGDSSGKYTLRGEAKFKGGCTPNFFGITTSRLPVGSYGGTKFSIDGKIDTFDVEAKRYVLWSNNFKEMKLASKSGHIVFGPGYAHMQDNRRWEAENYSLRIGFTPWKNIKSDAVFNLPITVVSGDRSLGDVDVPPYIINEGKEWAAVDNRQDVIPGSALDFSGSCVTPAGTKGFMTVRDDKFCFEKEPDKPVRFYGTNLVGTSQVISKDKSEILAKRLAAFGFNSVRIHHHDNEVCDRKDTRKLDPELMDNFDYLIYCFKKNGLYITTDVYVSRRNITKLELPQYGPITGLSEYKALLWVDDDVFQNWKDAAKNFYTHVNPYTGLALIDDPVLISLSLVNEGNPIGRQNASSRVSKLYKAKLEEFRKSSGNAKATMDDLCRHRAIARFKQMKEYMISLGCKVPVTDQNFRVESDLAWMRSNYDYADVHCYFDHPRFVGKQWALPIAPNNHNVLNMRHNLPSVLFPARILGMPFFVTEFDFASPNTHRLHGPALMASYAAFQDWDGIYQFAYSHTGKHMFDLNAVGNYFDLARDPAKALAHKLAARIFLHGKVKPAERTVALVPPKNGSRYWSPDVNSLGYVAKIGSDVGKANAKYDVKFDESFFTQDAYSKFNRKNILPKGYLSNSGLLYWTPQLRYDVKNASFRLTSDGAEVISLQPKSKLSGRILAVENGESEATVGLIPRDTASFKTAKRLVLIHLTDLQTTGRHFASKQMTQMNTWGKAPFLVRRGSSTISLKLKPGKWKIYSLGLDGERKKQIKYSLDKDGRLQFTVNTADQMACELVCE